VASFGARLKQEREQRGVTLDQISQSTKIGTRFLQALEHDHFEQLPGGIFNKGFIRAYARFVGLDEEQTVADYLAAISPPAPAAATPPIAPPPSPPQTRTAFSWSTAAMVLLLFALCFAIWGFYSRESPAKSAVPSTPVASPPASLPLSAAAPEPAVSPTSAPPQKSTVPILSASRPESAMIASPLTSASPSAATFDLRIGAREDSWVSITADGKVLMQDTIPAGTEKSVKATKQIVIRTGNAGALDLAFNGEKLPTQGEVGEVKTLEFGPDGLEVTISRRPVAPNP
jgi:cytoskeleton protein RodZ